MKCTKLTFQALEIPDKHRRRIIAVVERHPDGLSTDEVKISYAEMYEEPFPYVKHEQYLIIHSAYQCIKLISGSDSTKLKSGSDVRL